LSEPNSLNLIEQLDQVLPQTQCQRCGFPACRPYAEAMALGEAMANRCPPGGQQGVKELATILGQAETKLDDSRGSPGVGFVVKIDPEYCIGCTKCIRACPVDAIIGANKRMHTVISELCTGCELCIPPCPTDCISLEPRNEPNWGSKDAQAARRRYLMREARLAIEGALPPSYENEAQNLKVDATSNSSASGTTKPPFQVQDRQGALEKAMEQARQRLAKHSTPADKNATG
jgi:Na+-translocating ferredoxin:NAD+ oxidoreductase subunit B